MNINYLFKTEALKIAPADKPFWYTSGLIGPHYINTHFLCGGEDTAKEILAFIDEAANDVASFPARITEKLEKTYQSHSIFKDVIDTLSEKVSKMCSENKISFISGGQRRDWFFAPIVANKTNLPCLYIYNNLSIFDATGKQIKDLNSAKVINVADLLTAGSSYTSKWVPALSQINARLIAAANIVDRREGGEANLAEAGIEKFIALFKIDQRFFETALEENYINSNQHKLLTDYFQNPHQTMQNWLNENPDFIKQALESDDEKTRQRAESSVDQKLYDLNSL